MSLLICTITGFHNGKCYIYILNNVLLNKQNPNIIYTNGKIGDRLLLKYDVNYTVKKNYGNHNNRLKDVDIIKDLYNYTKNISLTDNYIFSNPLYTQSFKDLTCLHTFNIDPTLSTDFDDAISFDIDSKTIYIHIVDINSSIPINSDIDLNALIQSNTLYLPDYKQNMLPDIYADDLLSLVTNKIRKVITIEFKLDSDKFEIYKSTIIVKKRYDYINSLPENLSAEINIDYILLQLYKHLNNQVSTTLSIPCLCFKINKLGNLTNISNEHNDTISHLLIEKLMILCNTIISKHVDIQRIHHKPNDLIIHNTDNTLINSFLTILQYSKANYSVNESGHYGLKLSNYTHFTSPIRRYLDVINHRILSGVIFTDTFLENTVKYINQRETLNKNLCKLYTKIKLYYSPFLQLKQYNGFITNIVKSGVCFIIPDLMLTGFTHVSNMLYPNRWIFHNSTLQSNKITLYKSQKIIINITHINQLKLEIKSEIIHIE